MGNSTSSTTGSPSSRANGEPRNSASNTGINFSGGVSNLSSRIIGGGSNYNATVRSNLPLPISSLSSPFRSGTGSLGLTKAELDARCQPSGLYPTCEWEPKAIRRLIGDGKLAARLKGADCRETKSDRECPICFMYYSENNVTKCCEATICTECYLQIKTQRDKSTTCPFCNNPKMVVSVQNIMDEDAIAKREEEEQHVIESIIRNRVARVYGDSPNPSQGFMSPSPVNDQSDGELGFGSSLENYTRSRTFSNSSSALSEGSGELGGNCTTPNPPVNDADSLLSLAMSPEARRELEHEMRAQLSHETHCRMENEAEEARIRHAEEWSRTDSGIRSQLRDARVAELTSLLGRMTARNNTDSATFGAGILSEDGGERGRDDGSYGGLLHALEAYGGDRRSATRGALENLMRLEAALLLGQGTDDNSRRQRQVNRRSSLERRHDDNQASLAGVSGSPRRILRTIPRRGVSSTHMDTAELLMRGISEEEQLAMAIAMSMVEEQGQQQNQQEQIQEHNGRENQGPVSANGAANDEPRSSLESESDMEDGVEFFETR